MPANFRLCCQRKSRQMRSEEHTSELQSQSNLVCRLLLEKKNSHPATGLCIDFDRETSCLPPFLRCALLLQMLRATLSVTCHLHEVQARRAVRLYRNCSTL